MARTSVCPMRPAQPATPILQIFVIGSSYPTRGCVVAGASFTG